MMKLRKDICDSLESMHKEITKNEPYLDFDCDLYKEKTNICLIADIDQEENSKSLFTLTLNSDSSCSSFNDEDESDFLMEEHLPSW